jgi:hypothetical protein
MRLDTFGMRDEFAMVFKAFNIPVHFHCVK